MINITLSDYIKVSGLPKDAFNHIVQRLTYPNPNFVKAEKYGQGNIYWIPRTIKSYKYEKGELYLPRGYYMEFLSDVIAKLGNPYQIIDQRNQALVETNLKGIPLRSYQEKMIQEALAYNGPSFIMQAAPGAGKTFTGLELARRESRKTLWITHTKELCNQTTHAASDKAKVQVLGLPKEEIGLIGQGKFRIGDFLTIATVQTLSRRKAELALLKNEFGIVIVDEVHHAPASSWQLSTHMFAPYLTVGLTATSYRNDGLTQLMFDCMGPVVASADRSLLIQEGVLIVPTVLMVDTGINIHGVDFNSIISFMVDDKRRNNFLLEIIKSIRKNEDNTMIVLCARRQHVENLVAACDALGLNPMKMLGDMSATNRTLAAENIRSKKSKLIIATYKLLSEGFDYPSVNFVLFATPFRDSVLVEQCVGRTQRIAENKTSAYIIDPYDSNPIIMSQARHRYAVYAGLEMNTHSNLSVTQCLNYLQNL
jgi:superfamily II DNA or RNA helicase